MVTFLPRICPSMQVESRFQELKETNFGRKRQVYTKFLGVWKHSLGPFLHNLGHHDLQKSTVGRN
jgi:hypothetical protein